MGIARERGKAEVEDIPISQITVGLRRRKKLGPLTRLANSIQAHGLIHPIVVKDDGVLVVGERRLRACEKLGWKTIPGRRYEKLSQEELRALEQDENALRKDLDSYESSRERLRELQAQDEEPEEQLRPESGQKSRGRPKDPKSDRSRAKAAGIPQSTVQEMRRHVSVADEFPALQAADWKKSHVLRADECLKEIGDEYRKTFGQMISEPGIDRKTALEMLENVVSMPAREQKRIAKLYRSENPEKKILATTQAAKVPPCPPAYLIELSTAKKSLSIIAKKVPQKYRAQLQHITDSVNRVLAEMDKEYQTFKEKEMARWNSN